MYQQWVIVRNCNSLLEAEFIKSVLEADGIEAVIPNEYYEAWRGRPGNTTGGVQVLVRESELTRSVELLDSAKPAEESVDED